MIDFDPELDIVYLSPERFADSPQVGLPIRQNWRSLLRWLTWPTYAADKRAAGAWCPCALDGGTVKGGSGLVSLLVFDVDDCGADGIDKSAFALARYSGAVVPTFSATLEKTKHRIVIVPTRPLEPAEFKVAWPWMNRTFSTTDILVDHGCKNINRLYFSCVTRSPQTWLGARLLEGEPVDVDALLAAAREEAAELAAARARRPPPRPVVDQNRASYVAGAIDSARRNIASAPEGGRHDTLLRESFGLARFELDEAQISLELIETFVHVAGEARRTEGEKCIRDAVAARRRGAA